MNWLQACKEWNARKGGKYEVPRKGTAGYNEVRKLMGTPTKVKKGGAKTFFQGLASDEARVGHITTKRNKNLKLTPEEEEWIDSYEAKQLKKAQESRPAALPGEAGMRNLEAARQTAREKAMADRKSRVDMMKHGKGRKVKGGFLPLLTAGLSALPAILSLFKGSGKRMEQTAQHLTDELVGAGLVGGTHKSQYIRWMLGRVRGNREGDVKKPDEDEWGTQEDVYRRPYPKDPKRFPIANANPTDTNYAGWSPEDWEGKFSPFRPEDVGKRSKFIQALLPTDKKIKPRVVAPAATGKKEYKLNPSLRKFPGISSKQMVDFRNRVGSKRSQNTFGELTNMGKFFGDDDFLNKYDTAIKLEPFVKAWEAVKGRQDPKEWYRSQSAPAAAATTTTTSSSSSLPSFPQRKPTFRQADAAKLAALGIPEGKANALTLSIDDYLALLKRKGYSEGMLRITRKQYDEKGKGKRVKFWRVGSQTHFEYI